jgi:HEAT repeat protein
MQPTLENWLKLYDSPNREVRIRAAGHLLNGYAAEMPVDVLLEILDTLSHEGLGADAQKVLLARQGSSVFDAMVARLQFPDRFIRETACTVLGRSGNTAATPYLLSALSDPVMMVRRAAGFGLAFLRDPNSVPELLRHYAAARHDDINVRFALEAALKELGVEFNRHPL